ncbi:MAG: HlyD family secretion protein [Thermoguttaceae bacterium]
MTGTVQVDSAPRVKSNGDARRIELHDGHAAERSIAEMSEEHVQAPAPVTSAARPRRRLLAWAFAGVAAIAASAGGVAYYIHSLAFESTDDAFIEGHIVPVSSRVPGHVARVHVADNQLVKAGDLLAELDPPDFDTRLAAAEAAVRTAQATSQARATAVLAAQADLEQGKADVTAAEAREERANGHLKRIQSLVPLHAASQESLDEAIAGAHVAHADVTAARERIHAKQSAIAQAEAAGKAAESGVSQAEAELRQARLNRSYTKIYAPISGHIARKSVEVGAFVQVGQPLMALVDPDVWVVANFKETQLAKMRPGQPVVVTVDTHSDSKFPAHIDSIQRGSGAKFSLLPPENATGNYVKVVQRVPVKIVFDDPKQIERYGLGPGMSVVPVVNVQEPRGDSMRVAASRVPASR